jgi:predicted nucleic acid-binding protein
VIYLDSCALIKLVVDEAETTALRSFLSARGEESRVTSTLALTEVARALVRIGAPPSAFDRADLVLDRVLKIKMSDQLLRDAGRMPAVSLRSLDAIHVATAEYAELAVSAFVTYDKRLAEIAASRGLPVRSPV